MRGPLDEGGAFARARGHGEAADGGDDARVGHGRFGADDAVGYVVVDGLMFWGGICLAVLVRGEWEVICFTEIGSFMVKKSGTKR